MPVPSITSPRDFRRVLSLGRRARRDGVAVIALRRPGEAGPPRIGLAVSRAAGGAVVRNRIKRRLRAALRRCSLPPSYDLVVRAGAEVRRVDFQRLVADLGAAVRAAAEAPRG